MRCFLPSLCANNQPELSVTGMEQNSPKTSFPSLVAKQCLLHHDWQNRLGEIPEEEPYSRSAPLHPGKGQDRGASLGATHSSGIIVLSWVLHSSNSPRSPQVRPVCVTKCDPQRDLPPPPYAGDWPSAQCHLFTGSQREKCHLATGRLLIPRFSDSKFQMFAATVSWVGCHCSPNPGFYSSFIHWVRWMSPQSRSWCSRGKMGSTSRAAQPAMLCPHTDYSLVWSVLQRPCSLPLKVGVSPGKALNRNACTKTHVKGVCDPLFTLATTTRREARWRLEEQCLGKSVSWNTTRA